MAQKTLKTGIGFSSAKVFLTNLSLVDDKKQAFSISHIDVAKYGLSSSLSENNLSEDLRVKISNRIPTDVQSILITLSPQFYLYSIVPLSSDTDLSDQEALDQVAGNEHEWMFGEKKADYIFEWIPLSGQRLLVFWIPKSLIANLQNWVDKSGKNLETIDIEPLSLVNLLTEKKLLPDENHFNLLCGLHDNGFYFLSYNQNEIMDYVHFMDYKHQDVGYLGRDFLSKQSKNLRLHQVLYYGSISDQDFSVFETMTTNEKVRLVDVVKPLYSRHPDTPATDLNACIPAIAVIYPSN